MGSSSKKKKNRKRTRSLSSEGSSRVEEDSSKQVVKEVKVDPWALAGCRGASLRDDKKAVLAAISKDSFVFQYASERLRDDKGVVLEAVKQDGMLLLFASDRLKDDPDVVLAACKTCYTACNAGKPWNLAVLQLATDRLRNQKQCMLEILKFQRGWESLKYASKGIQEDREVALRAVAQDGRALALLAPKFQHDKEIVLKAVESHGSMLHRANQKFWKDKKIVLQALSHKDCGWMLQHASEALRSDKTVVKAAIENGDIYALQYASEDAQSDPEILKLAKESALQAFLVHHAEPKRFRELPPPLQDDKEIAQAAIQSPYFSSTMMSHMSERLQEDVSLFQEALERQRVLLKGATPPAGEHVLDFAPLSIRSELEIEEIRQNPLRFHHLPEELCHNREFALAAVTANPKVLKFLPSFFRNDRDVVRMAISQDASSLEYAAADLKSKEMVLQVVNKSGMALKHAGDMWRRDREIAEAAVRHTGAAIQFVAKELVDAHPEIARTAATRNLGAIQFIPEPLKSKLRNDPEIVAKAGRGLPPSAFWCHVGETLRKRVASAVSALRQHCGVSGTDEIKLTIHDEKSILKVAEELRERKEDQLNESITNLVVCAPLLTMFAGSSSCWDEEAGMTWNELPV